MSSGFAPVRWGVLGATSFVAQRAVLPALHASARCEVVAQASRPYQNYAALLADPAVEAVYIPLPNGLHREWVLRCAAAGKHVLCEKPLAMSAHEAEGMAAACAEAGVVLMEAYMTPFHPRSAEFVRRAQTELGELSSAHAAFTFPLRDRGNHRWDPALGGGALLDVGIYCIAPLLEIAGSDPVAVGASSTLGTTTGWLRFDRLLARFECSFEASEQQVLEVSGSAGTLRATRIFTGSPDDGADQYRAMVDHFAAAVRGVEPLRRGPAESVRLLRILDRLREASA